jgi:hypothetical protein
MQPTEKPSFTQVNARGLIVVAVLVVILIVVLVVQFAGGAATSSHDGGNPAAGSQARQPSNPSAQERRKRTDAHGSSDPWLPISLERVIGYDPFRTPDAPTEDESLDSSPDDEVEDEEDVDEEDAAALREQIEAARLAALAALTKRGVGAFLSGGKDGDVAVIGDRTVRAGDVIDGFRVIAIGPDGMVVEPVELP